MFVHHFVPHAFLTPMSVSTRDVLTDAVFEALERVGLADLTTGSLGRVMNTTPQAVLKRAGGRERLDRIVVGEFCRRWTRWCLALAPDPTVALPRDEIELHAVTVWHALGELARGAGLVGRPELMAAMEAARSADGAIGARC